MICPSCASIDNGVIDTRSIGTTIRRRRKCHACTTRWTTFEVAQSTFCAIEDARSALHASLDAFVKIAKLADVLQADGLLLAPNAAPAQQLEDVA